ncbi:hypothetical protein SAY86_007033 [Trapa natans]|uniref:Uncharacterized protein n=1 Tax=Trapa natans TaxID=22666 RepID=A0AAN7QWL9_TRANT|nr:hypothetical protein SAY86_007033 [Trapa natans]
MEKPAILFGALSTHSEERLVNEVNELGRSPDKLLKDRSLQIEGKNDGSGNPHNIAIELNYIGQRKCNERQYSGTHNVFNLVKLEKTSPIGVDNEFLLMFLSQRFQN